MPVVQVTLIEGYSEDARRRLCEALTRAVRAVIDAPAEGVTVAINEVAPAAYMRGGVARTPGAAHPAAAETALAFLAAQGARDLAAADALKGEGFEMVFPGGVVFRDWEALLEWGAPRYRSIGKRIERVEESPLGDAVAVHVSGSLEGERPDGAPFAGIRFIDRFEVAGGRVMRQEVWNDLAEVLGRL